MPEDPTDGHPAQGGSDPRAQLIQALLALGYDRDQIRNARFAGPGEIRIPESAAATEAFKELASLVGDENAQAVREAGARAGAAHHGDAFAARNELVFPTRPRPGDPPTPGTPRRSR